MPSVRELVTTWGFQVDTKPLTQLDKTLHGLKTAVNTLVTGFALKEFWKLIESTAEAGHEAELTAQKVGVNSDKLQAMQYAAKLVNVSQEEMSTGLKFLSRHMYDASLGSASAMKNFYLLGISIRDSNKHLKQADNVMAEISAKFQAMPDDTRKTALAVKLFGHNGIAMIPFLNKGPAFMAKFSKEAKEFGYVMDKDARKKSEEFMFTLRRMEMMFIGIKRQIGLGLMPIIKQMLDKFVDWYKINREIIQQRLAEGVKLLAAGMEMVWNVISRPWLAAAAGLVTLFALIDLVPLSLIAAAALIYLIMDDIVSYLNGKDSVLGRIINGLQHAFEKILPPELNVFFVQAASFLHDAAHLTEDISEGWKAIAESVTTVVNGLRAMGLIKGEEDLKGGDRGGTAGGGSMAAFQAYQNQLHINPPSGGRSIHSNVTVNVAGSNASPERIAQAVSDAMDASHRAAAKNLPNAVHH